MLKWISGLYLASLPQQASFKQKRKEIIMSTKTPFNMVKEFHETFGHPVCTEPKLPHVKRVKLRLDLILEEIGELIDSIAGSQEEHRYLMASVHRIDQARKLIQDAPAYEFKKADILHVAKELSDVNYVVQGAGLELGFDLDLTTSEVHESNMSKCGEDGRPIYNEKGKVLKGPFYRLPDMAKPLKLKQEEA